jgi:hypothetical protein
LCRLFGCVAINANPDLDASRGRNHC